jgi:nucleotide sugar dehydrogenase|tara:strand:- start:357 stop:1205 length:849 start_codon:yes stop_codon:yes gene_type:complete
MKIGIVGNGFVGSSVAFGFSPTTGCDSEIKIYDKDSSKATHSLESTLTSDFIFVSVPTPSNPNGSINLDVVYNVFEEMNSLNHRTDNVILLRSTVTPGTTRKLQRKFKNLNIVFNPEFLTERSAKLDFINQARFILGGRKKDTNKVEKLMKWRFGETMPVIKTNYETAELIKYMNNCFFATKVSFLNEMYQIADKCGADWDMAVEGFVRDGRVGHSHMNVPGPDGKFGFGGSCFPKDIQAMINFAESLDIEPSVLLGAWDKNLDVRPEEDWKKLKGRAVVDE